MRKNTIMIPDTATLITTLTIMTRRTKVHAHVNKQRQRTFNSHMKINTFYFLQNYVSHTALHNVSMSVRLFS